MEPENSKATGDDVKRKDERSAGESVALKADDSLILRGGMSERKFAQVSRRELLKVAPVLVLGAFAIPAFQPSLLKKGLAFSDWTAAKLFRRGHLATTFQDAEVTPFEKFPINGY